MFKLKKKISSIGVFGYTYSLQGLNYLISFFSLPIVINSLSLEDYGFLSYLISISTTVTAFCNWGSYTSNIKRTANTIFNGSNLKDKIIISCFVQIILFIICFFIFLSLIIIFPNLRNSFLEPNILFSLLCIIFSSLLNPTWIFICLNKLREFTIFTVSPKIISLILFSIFLNKYPTILNYSILLFISNIFVLPMILKKTNELISNFEKKKNLKLVEKNLKFNQYFISACNEIKEDIYPGTGSTIAKVLPTSTYFLISSLFGYKVLGLFALADRVRSLGITLSQPIMQASLPTMSHKKDNLKRINSGLKLLKALAISSILFSIILYFTSPYLINFLSSGKLEYTDSIKLLRIMIPSIFFTNITTGLIYIILIPSGLNKSILKQSFTYLFINIFILLTTLAFSLETNTTIGISFIAAEIITLLLVLSGRDFRKLILKK